jgi:hypothetical protein
MWLPEASYYDFIGKINVATQTHENYWNSDNNIYVSIKIGFN